MESLKNKASRDKWIKHFYKDNAIKLVCDIIKDHKITVYYFLKFQFKIYKHTQFNIHSILVVFVDLSPFLDLLRRLSKYVKKEKWKR